jgi:farnesyl-diphosphate farnesyltransferase
VALAYLLARIADTLADSWGGPAVVRRDLLLHFRAALGEAALGRPPPFELPPPPSRLRGAEERLLRSSAAALALLANTPRALRPAIERVVLTLTEGMLVDMERFEPAEPTALATAAELDRYTYLIAGCVGEFWTDIGIHTGVWTPAQRSRLAAGGVRFGKGLQLVNILRDVASDFRRGRVYLPAEDLAKAALRPEDLGDPACFPRLRPLYGHYIEAAAEHLAAGQNYILAVPRRHYRFRLACIWPLWIGLATLRALAACPNVLASPPIRIPQGVTNRLLARSLVCAVSDRLLERMHGRLSNLTR